MNPYTITPLALSYKPVLTIPSFGTHGDHKGIDLSMPAPKNQPDRPVRRTAVLARDIRNPLTTINLSLDLLRAAITDPELRVYINMIARNSLRIEQQIKELLKCEETESRSQTHY